MSYADKIAQAMDKRARDITRDAHKKQFGYYPDDETVTVLMNAALQRAYQAQTS